MPVTPQPIVWTTGQVSLPVGDEAPVLHGPSCKVGDGDQVQLGEGVGHPKEALVGGKHSGRNLQRSL